MNNTIKTIQLAADQHLEKARSSLQRAVNKAALEPLSHLKSWIYQKAVSDLSKAGDETERVQEFSVELQDCRACIAPDDIAGDGDAAIEGAIAHFNGLAAECEQYADDLQAILDRRF